MVTVVVVVLLYGCQFLVFGEWVGVVGGQHCYCKIDKNLRKKGRREERKSGRWCGRKEEREGKKERECLYFFSVLILAGV